MDGIDSISFTYLFKVIHSSKLLHQSCINTCRTNKQSLVLACYLNACEVASQTSLCTDLDGKTQHLQGDKEGEEVAVLGAAESERSVCTDILYCQVGLLG